MRAKHASAKGDAVQERNLRRLLANAFGALQAYGRIRGAVHRRIAKIHSKAKGICFAAWQRHAHTRAAAHYMLHNYRHTLISTAFAAWRCVAAYNSRSDDVITVL